MPMVSPNKSKMTQSMHSLFDVFPITIFDVELSTTATTNVACIQNRSLVLACI